MNQNLRKRISNILTRARAEQWEDRSFSLAKASVCAELCSIVYEDVQEHDLKHASRIHLFASDVYDHNVKTGKTSSILDSVVSQQNEEARFFVVRGRHAIVLGTAFDNVVILAVRGTVFRELWDWKSNIDTDKYCVQKSEFNFFDLSLSTLDDTFFHRGFFESIAPQFASIADEIKRVMGTSASDPHIVWTGHSLGGAMAAIGNALHNSRIARSSFAEPMSGSAVGAYTFGMPRYCGLGALLQFATPHHVYRKEDLVPTLPPRKMGFVDCSREYEISATGTVIHSLRTDTFGIVAHLPKLWSSIKAHSIEGYAKDLAITLGISRP